MFEDCPAAESPLPDLAPDEFALWAGLLQTHATLARQLDADLRAAHGLPLADFDILLWLTKGPCERMRMAALADTVLLSPSGLSRAVERLQSRGLVRREPCTEDRRGAFAMLTDAGSQLVSAAAATHAASIRRHFLDRLTVDQRRVLANVWRRVPVADDRACVHPPIAPLGDRAAGRSRRATRRNPFVTTARISTADGESMVSSAATRHVSATEMMQYHDRVVAEFRANHGRVGGPFADAPLLLLTTTGAKSRQARTSPLTYTRDGSRYIIIAAKQGAPTNPDWYHNLVANPQVTVEVGDETFRAVAHVTEGTERQRLFDQMAAQRPNFLESQRKTSRQLPVIVLERVLDKESDYQAFNRDIIAEFRANAGKVGGIFTGLPVLLLTTTGAKSGQPRIAPLLYGVDGDRLVVVASKGGAPANPDWYRNLLTHPDIAVEVGTEAFPVRATIAQGGERQRLFALLSAVVPKLEESQASTSRQLPIVVLERSG